MIKDNKKLLIIVGCLLLVVGISFAYFAAKTLSSGAGESITATTTVIRNTELKVEGDLAFNDLDIYPGHKNISSIKLTATGSDKLVPYNVIWNGSNTLNTSLNYTVYKTSNKIDSSVSCNKLTNYINGNKAYYEECSISNINELGEVVSSGTITSGTNKVNLISNEFIEASDTGTVVYYYIILEYPNLDEPQNEDIGGSFNGTITIEENNVTSDIKVIGIYIEEDGEYKESDVIPEDGYKINTSKSTCSNNASVGYDTGIYISNLNQKGTECTLYFDEYVLVKDTLLANYPTQLTRTDFSTRLEEETTGTIYYADTSKGRTYYFAGNPTDNWVKFGGFYWRIIRINEDGTLRLIYQGTSANTTGTGTQIGTSTFSINSSTYKDNAYVGYMYTLNEVHGTSTESGIKKVVDDWYEANIKGTEYENSISTETGFCGDRTPSTSNSSINNSGGTGTTVTYYAPYTRLYGYSKQPTFECSNDSDLYTVKGSSKGNKALTYPVGLITMDEVWYAGGYTSRNQSYYLYTRQVYWTMSPYLFNNGGAFVFVVYSGGNLGSAYVTDSYGVRPVINLKADVQITGGNGSSNTPFEIS